MQADRRYSDKNGPDQDVLGGMRDKESDKSETRMELKDARTGNDEDGKLKQSRCGPTQRTKHTRPSARRVKCVLPYPSFIGPLPRGQLRKVR